MRFSGVEALELEAGAVGGHEVFTDQVVFESGSFWLPVSYEATSVDVQVHLVNEAPGEVTGDEAVEFSCRGPAGVRDPDNFERRMEFLPDDAVYRVRATSEGQGRRMSLTLTAWPGDSAPTMVLRERPAPPHCLDLPEAPSGLAAAARIGRDVDQAQGHRTLSGRTGTAYASRTVPGTPAHLRSMFGGHHTWTDDRDETRDESKWEMQGHSAFGALAHPCSPDHPDRLTGAKGVLALDASAYWGEIFEHLDKGGRRPSGPVVVRLNWYVADRPLSELLNSNGWLPREEADRLRPFLPEWTTRTARFTSVRPATKPPSTRIAVEHEGLPVEWVADMETWWAFQLAIHTIHLGLP